MKKAQPNPQVIIPSLDIFPLDEKETKKYLGKLKIGQKIKITFFGSDKFVVPVLQTLEANFDVISVVTAPGSAIELEAKNLNIPTLTPDRLDSDFLTSNFSLLTSDLMVVASYGKILPKEILDLPKYGALNIHPSLLPKYRGPSPVPTTILNDDKETGVTIIKMDEQIDHGPIIFTKKVSLSGKEYFTQLINKLFQLGAEVLVDIIPDFISGRLPAKEQNHKKAIYCKILKKDDGYFDIGNPPDSQKLDRMIRAYHPWPGVWTLWEVQSAKGKVKRVVKFLPDGKIQMEGKKPQPCKDFLNGYPDFPLKFK